MQTSPDIVILGAGIAGLWTCARLAALGFDVLCLDTGPLGGTQTIGAQGIIHGGMKYALTGEATRAAQAIALMPPIWAACLAGEGELDLSGLPVHSDHTLLWTTPGLLSRLAAFGAKNVLRTPVASIPLRQRPAPFAGVAGIDVYRVGEPVLDVAAVLSRLLKLCAGRVRTLDPASLQLTAAGGSCLITTNTAAGTLTLRPRLTVALAGAANARLASSVGASNIRMQTRPLHMAMVRSAVGKTVADGLPALYGHCLGAGNLPRLSVTTCRDLAGRVVWYIGGQIAESGVVRGRADQIAAAKKELNSCLPWLDLTRRTDLQWSTVRWDRAEGFMPDGSRPDEPVLVEDATTPGMLFGWPTKLAFAPRLAEMVIDRARHASGDPASAQTLRTVQVNSGDPGTNPARIALPAWDEPLAEWS